MTIGISLGKWTKHQLMLKDENLVKYLPDTQLLSEDSFWVFLDNYNQPESLTKSFINLSL